MNEDAIFIKAFLKKIQNQSSIYLQVQQHAHWRLCLRLCLNNPLQFIVSIILEWHWAGHEMLFAMKVLLLLHCLAWFLWWANYSDGEVCLESGYLIDCNTVYIGGFDVTNFLILTIPTKLCKIILLNIKITEWSGKINKGILVSFP